MSDSVKSKKSDKRRRVRLVAVRLTEGEYARVSEAAALADVTIPDYLRSTGLRRPLSQGRKIGGTVAAPADLRRLLGEVNKIGSNLNQIALTVRQGGNAAGPRREDVMAMIKVCTGLRDHFKATLLANLRSWEDGYD